MNRGQRFMRWLDFPKATLLAVLVGVIVGEILSLCGVQHGFL